MNHGRNDLFFCYQEAFNDLLLNPDKNMLTIFRIKRDVFQQDNFQKRSGSCYIIRKGKYREDLPVFFDGPIIDGLPDKEVAVIFNQCEYCISYDQYTMYSIYAASCGCISVVIPLHNVEKEVWQPQKELQYGIAYGMTPAEIQYAKDTKCKMEEYLDSINIENIKQIQSFATRCEAKFRRS
jgi:hypothetical protein